MADPLGPPVKRAPSPLRHWLSKAFAATTYFLGIWRVAHALLPLVRRKRLLAVFTFHRIATRLSEREHLVTYDKGTPAEIFDLQLEGIKSRYDILTLDEFIEVVTGRRQLERHASLVTFDDADSEFISQALPVLKKHAVPSVVFVPTDFIDSDKKFWHLRVSNAFHKLKAHNWPKVQSLAREFPEDKRDWLDNLDIARREDLATACWRFNIALDRMSEEEIEKFVDRLEAITGREYTLGIRTMTSGELRQAQTAGVYIESHSASHCKLARLEIAKAEQELEDSKTAIERLLDKQVAAVCYPAGSFSDEVAAAAAAAGYTVGFTTQFGFINYPAQATELLTLTRFDMRGSNRLEIARFLGELPFRRFRKAWPLR